MLNKVKNILITGHTTGLGKELNTILSKSYNVIGVSTKELDFNKKYKAPSHIKNINYDYIIINARSNNHRWSELININCTNQIRFALNLKNNINKALIFISSRLSRISEVSTGKCDGRIDRLDYAISKAGLNIASVYLSRHCEYPVFAIDPGSFANRKKPNKPLKAIEIANSIKKLLNNSLDEYNGKLVKYTGEIVEW